MLFVFFVLFSCINMVSASDNITSNDNLEINQDLNEEDSVYLSDVGQLGISEENQLGNATGTGKTFDDIQKMVNNAESNDVINLEGEYVSSGKSINVNKDLTIQGSNDATLKANGQVKCFNLDSYSNIVFKNLKIVDANQAIFSDYVPNVHRSITCINCTFINNYHTFINNYYYFDDYHAAYGGAIETFDSLTVIGCNFINCSSSIGGAVYCLNGVFKDSNFISNTADEGGAIWASKLTAVNCNFSNNKAKEYGGAIVNDMDGFNVTNCRFINNYAKGFGSAIYSYSKYPIDSGYHMIVVNSKFLDNSADYLDTEFAQNQGQIYKYSDWGDGTIFTYYRKSVELKYLFSNSGGLSKTQTTPVVITPAKLTATYNSGKLFKFTVTDKKTKKAVKNLAVTLKIYVPKKLYASASKLYKNFVYDSFDETSKYWIIYTTIYTNSKGVASLKFNHAVGFYKIEAFPAYLNYAASKVSSTIKISKAPTTIKAPKVTAKYKKSKYFKVTVKNKATKKVVKNIKVKIKVYTGKKYKAFTVKTNKKGVAKLNTKKLKRGKHKVVITSGNKNYKISAKSVIRIR